MNSELTDPPIAPIPGDGTASGIDSSVLDPALRASRSGRFDTMEALHALEEALGAPTPRRERTWLHKVLAALDLLSAALDSQLAGDREAQSLLAEIRRDDPRLAPRVDRLRAEQADLRIAITSLRDQLTPDAALPVDTADIRDRLASIARRLRAQRAQESDLVYEAVNVDLGVSD